MLARFGVRTIRQFSSAVDSQVPLRLHGIDGTYATALYTVANKTNKTAEVEQDLKKLSSTLKKDDDLRTIFQSPLLNLEQRMKTAESVSSTLKLTPTTSNLLAVLAENARLNYVEQVADAFNSLVAAKRGEVQVTITSAEPLSPNNLRDLEAAIKKSGLIKANQTPAIQTQVDGDILGGIVVQIEDRLVDLSIASKINAYAKSVAEQSVTY